MDTKEGVKEQTLDEKVRQNVNFLYANFYQTQRKISTLEYKIERLLVENNLLYDPPHDSFQSGRYLLRVFNEMEKKMKIYSNINKLIIAAVLILLAMNVFGLYLLYNFQ